MEHCYVLICIISVSYNVLVKLNMDVLQVSVIGYEIEFFWKLI